MKTQARDQMKFFWTTLRKVVKITISHHSSGDHLLQQQQQQKQQKQRQREAISFHGEQIPQLEVCMLNTQLANF